MLRTTHTSTVTEDQIDHLGHMNVRFYGVNALAGTRALLVDLPGWGSRHLVHDTYTRHHREQLLGTALEVRSAVLGADTDGVRIHHELAATDTGTLAATFVHRASPLDADGQRLPVPAEAVAAATAEAIALPEHAAPRTVSLEADLLATAPDLATLERRGLAFRKERRVEASECDERGRYRVEMAPMLSWGGEQVEGESPDFLHETSGGQLMGWAVMETRAVFDDLPSAGARVQSFAATIALHDKVLHRVNWAFDLDAGVLLSAFESVNMAFDIRARQPMSIPEGYRRVEQDRLQPDLAPQAPA